MSVIDVEPRAVHQRLVARNIFLLVRRVFLAVHLKAARVGQWILLIVIPENLARVVFAIGVDEQHTARDGIEVRISANGDPVLDLRTHHLRNRHRIST